MLATSSEVNNGPYSFEDFELDSMECFDTEQDSLSSADPILRPRDNKRRKLTHTQHSSKHRKLVSPAEAKTQANPAAISGALVPTEEKACIEESSMLFRFLFSSSARLIKHDTIAAFPTNFASCLNSGDFRTLNSLVNSHLDQHCDISLSYCQSKLSCQAFVHFFELMNEVHPDRIMCVHTSETYGNRVLATIYMKFTDCKPLYESVARMVKDPVFASFFPCSRAEILKRKMKTEMRPEAERRQLEALLESDSDLVVYGCVQVVLTTNEVTQKGIGLQLLCDFNTAHVADFNCF